jgi:hypothetical protein
MRNPFNLLLCFLLAAFCATAAPAGTPPGGTEAKLDEFMTEYIKRIKAALAVKDDNQMLTMLQKMKTDFCPWAKRLAPEVQAWTKSMSEAEEEAYRKRAENKPYVAELLKIGFNPANSERIDKNPKLKAAMKEMDDCINQVDKEKEEAAPESETEEESESEEDTDNDN